MVLQMFNEYKKLCGWAFCKVILTGDWNWVGMGSKLVL
jgi:hypothetical protein